MHVWSKCEIELASKSCCRGRHCRLAVSNKGKLCDCAGHMPCPSPSPYQVMFGHFLLQTQSQSTPPPIQNIVLQTTLGLWLRRKPDNWLCSVFVLYTIVSHPVPRCFQGTPVLLLGAVVTNMGSIFCEAASLWASAAVAARSKLCRKAPSTRS